MAAGYSGTPLPRKLGIREGHRVALLSAPAGFAAVLGALPEGVVLRASGSGAYDVGVLFVRTAAELAARFAPARGRLDDSSIGGGLWVAWPKRASGVPTDLTEDRVREVALGAGLVDNKVCAIDDTWSGLRCVVRVADRARGAAAPVAPAGRSPATAKKAAPARGKPAPRPRSAR
jgi:hypothetical protein